MANTNPKDFERLLSRIPEQNKANVWFLPIRGNKKIPDVPKGTTLKNNRYYKLSGNTVLKRLRNGQNAGVYALSGGLMFLDVDVKNGIVQAPEKLLEAIPETFTVKSRNGGFQYYFLNSGLYDNQELILDDRFEGDDIRMVLDGGHIGELRTNWQYVVCPGSYVPPDVHSSGGDGTYRVVKNIEIAEFEGDITRYFKKNTEKIKGVESFSMRTIGKGKSITAEDIKNRLETKKMRVRAVDGEGIENLVWQIKNNVW